MSEKRSIQYFDAKTWHEAGFVDEAKKAREAYLQGLGQDIADQQELERLPSASCMHAPSKGGARAHWCAGLSHRSPACRRICICFRTRMRSKLRGTRREERGEKSRERSRER